MVRAIVIVVAAALLVNFVHAHGGCVVPRQRGIVCPKKRGYWIKPWDEEKCRNAPNRWDWDWHFPAGLKKSGCRGCGAASQRRASGNNWTPYDPKAPGFRFRAGVCGDLKGPKEDHRRGGKFYYPKDKPIITGSYKSGGIFSATVSINSNGHHNGFIEFIVCKVSECGGEISESCLRSSACQKMIRVEEPRCETNSRDCAPIDPKYPTRWFLPCTKTNGKANDLYKNINFHLPKGLVCDHCVVQFYWASANECNPPGYADYFEGPNAPKWWGQCKGQSNARGGWAKWLKTCGGKLHTEEYYSCMDIEIKGNGGDYEDKDLDTRKGAPALPEPVRPKPEPVRPKPQPFTPVVPEPIQPKPRRVIAPSPTSSPSPTPSSTPPAIRKPSPPARPTRKPVVDNRNTPFKYVRFYVNGRPRFAAKHGDRLQLPSRGRLSMEAVTKYRVPRVYFKVQGERDWSEGRAPYFWRGNNGKFFGELRRKIRGRWLKVEVVIWLRRRRYNMVFHIKM